jgi:MFS transporter, DHA1 family, multidrug resistance protein
MADIIREAPLGQLIRWVTSNKYLKYPEEEKDFQCPKCYQEPDSVESLSSIEEEKTGLENTNTASGSAAGVTKDHEGDPLSPARVVDYRSILEDLHTQRTNATVKSGSDRPHDLEKLHTQGTSFTIRSGFGGRPVLTRTKTREMTRAYTAERFEIEREEQAVKNLNLPIVAQKNEEGDILVDWYSTDDPANPQNWSSKKKAFVGLQIL